MVMAGRGKAGGDASPSADFIDGRSSSGADRASGGLAASVTNRRRLVRDRQTLIAVAETLAAGATCVRLAERRSSNAP
jgi:hypothetical protein